MWLNRLRFPPSSSTTVHPKVLLTNGPGLAPKGSFPEKTPGPWCTQCDWAGYGHISSLPVQVYIGGYSHCWEMDHMSRMWINYQHHIQILLIPEACPNWRWRGENSYRNSISSHESKARGGALERACTKEGPHASASWEICFCWL